MLSFCKRTVFVSDNVFSSLLQGGHHGSGWADNREAFRDVERTPVPPFTSYLFSTVFRFSSGSSVLSSHFHPALQMKDFLIFAYFLCLKERNGTSLKMQDFIISDIAKLNR